LQHSVGNDAKTMLRCKTQYSIEVLDVIDLQYTQVPISCQYPRAKMCVCKKNTQKE